MNQAIPQSWACTFMEHKLKPIMVCSAERASNLCTPQSSHEQKDSNPATCLWAVMSPSMQAWRSALVDNCILNARVLRLQGASLQKLLACDIRVVSALQEEEVAHAAQPGPSLTRCLSQHLLLKGKGHVALPLGNVPCSFIPVVVPGQHPARAAPRQAAHR